VGTVSATPDAAQAAQGGGSGFPSARRDVTGWGSPVPGSTTGKSRGYACARPGAAQPDRSGGSGFPFRQAGATSWGSPVQGVDYRKVPVGTGFARPGAARADRSEGSGFPVPPGGRHQLRFAGARVGHRQIPLRTGCVRPDTDQADRSEGSAVPTPETGPDRRDVSRVLCEAWRVETAGPAQAGHGRRARCTAATAPRDGRPPSTGPPGRTTTGPCGQRRPGAASSLRFP
jgi:hypothetical protein